MGGDGGSIPKRDELVQLKKKPEQKDKDSVRIYRWQHCSLTQQPLQKPIVACELGRLYNKESILQMLIDKGEKPPNIRHIKNLKDVKELELTDNPSYKGKGANKGDGQYDDRHTSPWICPITGLEMNGRFRFVFDWSNGKVMSDRAYKMVKSDSVMRIAEENMVVLNPDEGDEVDLMRTKMEERRARAKLAKKASKEAKRKASDEEKSQDGDVKKVKTSKSAQAPAGPSKPGNGKNTKSVQEDATKSEVFKSLFSTHKSAANKPKAHWVTFDPRYN